MSGDAPAPAAPAESGGGSTESSTSSTPAAPAAPQSTADIASKVIERADHAPDPHEEEPQAPGAPALSATERFTEEERLLREFGFKRAKREDGSEHRIERSKVLAMIASGLKRGRDQWTAEKGTLETELGGLREFRDGFAQQLRGDPDAFLAYVAQHDPRYRRYLEQQTRQPEARNDQSTHDDEEPLGDIDLGNGVTTFSPTQLKKWLAWSVEQRLQERLRPLAEAHEEQKRRAAYEHAQGQMREKVRGQMAEATQWPHWDDYSDAILAKLQADTDAAEKAGDRPKMTLREAYLEAKADALSQGVNQARERVIGDLQNAPRSTALRTSAEVPRQASMRSTADIARANIERGDRNR